MKPAPAYWKCALLALLVTGLPPFAIWFIINVPLDLMTVWVGFVTIAFLLVLYYLFALPEDYP